MLLALFQPVFHIFISLSCEPQGLTSPSSQFIQLDPNTPDLSIPELQRRVELEEKELHRSQKVKGDDYNYSKNNT